MTRRDWKVFLWASIFGVVAWCVYFRGMLKEVLQ